MTKSIMDGGKSTPDNLTNDEIITKIVSLIKDGNNEPQYQHLMTPYEDSLKRIEADKVFTEIIMGDEKEIPGAIESHAKHGCPMCYDKDFRNKSIISEYNTTIICFCENCNYYFVMNVYKIQDTRGVKMIIESDEERVERLRENMDKSERIFFNLLSPSQQLRHLDVLAASDRYKIYL